MNDHDLLVRLAEIEGLGKFDDTFGLKYSRAFDGIIHMQDDDFELYNPLNNDAQAMALVKKYHLDLMWADPESVGMRWKGWLAILDDVNVEVSNICLNRAIVMAVVASQ